MNYRVRAKQQHVRVWTYLARVFAKAYSPYETAMSPAAGTSLAEQYHDHALVGDFAGFRECHVTPDWLLIYCIDNDLLILTLSRTGTHSDLFGK